MRFVDRYPIIVTPKLRECRDFWRRHLGFTVVFEATWFVLLQAEGASATLAFMSPDHPSAPPGPEVFPGFGTCFELQVENAAAAFDEFQRDDGPVGLHLVDEPFGQRRFGFTDPSGLWVDVVEQIDPAAGFWEGYVVDAEG
ncbi:VOC family protein [Phreatobacter stygius]|uniref:Glyoxalase n=1 Tax=Phreatobacter stygius TaxID=1940610 RepID=A0A4D7B914_9HYPH|nr:VOC family protein [Phreatobacter stygius]QCI66970.1 glyoxalase [Phreatobacter stygius]